MAEPKTKKNSTSPLGFINSVENPVRREDALIILSLMEKITGCKPEMWGGSIIGYGSQFYTYANGKKGEWMKIGFSPRKAALTIYVLGAYEGEDKLLKRLGKHKTGKSCLYINKLADIDMAVLEELIEQSYKSDSATC